MNTFISPDLIFFIVVAALLILKLKSVLGRRTGNEKRPKNFFMYQDTTLNTRKSVLSNEKSLKNKIDEKQNKEKLNIGNNAIDKICFFDRNFTIKKFLSGAKTAFEMIIKSFAKGNINKIKNLLGSDVYSTFSKAIKARVQKKQTLEHTLVSIKKVKIENIHVKSSIADIVVKFVSEQVNLLKNKKGKTLGGNDEYIENHTDYWTFSKNLKSSDPNWKLVVTKAV